MKNNDELATHIGRYVNILDSPIQFKISMGGDKYAATYYDIYYYVAHGVYCHVVLHYGRTITSSRINQEYITNVSHTYRREIALFKHYYQVGTGVYDTPDYIMINDYSIYAVTKTTVGYASRLCISIYPYKDSIIRKQNVCIDLST